MPVADSSSYLSGVVAELGKPWPQNRAVNLVFHGHSVPAGYFATPVVDTFHAYPHLLHARLKRRFPHAVINAIVTAIGGEHSENGSRRFEAEVLAHRPDVVFIDYALNDRAIGLDRAAAAWRRMLEAARAGGVKTILLTPTPDLTQAADYDGPDREHLLAQAAQVRTLAAEFGVGLADSAQAFVRRARTRPLRDLLSSSNHPNVHGHRLVANELYKWFGTGVPR